VNRVFAPKFYKSLFTNIESRVCYIINLFILGTLLVVSLKEFHHNCIAPHLV